MSTKLFVGSLPWSVNDKTLQQTFEAHGTVVSAKIITDRDTGRSRGFGFVEMENPTDAEKAIRSLNNSELDGRNIVVNEAKARS
ncbi:MAG: RNA-binding protein [Ignavibacteria bacterium GWA2_35_9]|nr:MAG: RNA-binding protein [Ignavibacteria bacterium GWA2_35_9]OGU46184.1 MAG: RNA-binding protein [Ignavibacteria bacterium GWB2_36_8]